MVKANHALSNSALVGSRELQSCTVYNHLPPPGVQCITQNKIPIKRFWIQAIKQYQTQLFWAWCLNKIKTHQIILKKKSNVKTESPLGKQKSQGNLTSARFRRKMLTIQANWGAKSKIEMISTCRFKDLLLGKQMYWHFHGEYVFEN